MKKFTSVVTFVASLGILAASQGAGATNFFNWSVESDTTSVAGQRNLGFLGGTSRSSAAAHTGTYSMKLNVNGNDGGNAQKGADLWPHIDIPYDVVGGPAIYYRWWMRIEPGFSWGAFGTVNSYGRPVTAKTKSSRVSGKTYPRVYTGYVWVKGFWLEECEDVGSVMPGGGCPSQGVKINYDMRPMADGRWHEYIVMVKPNTTPTTSDAQFKAWVDGQLVGQALNFLLHNKSGNAHDEGWAGWMVKPYFQLNGETTDGGVIYVDDFSTDDTWNSTLTGTPPLWPGNIQ